MPGFVLGPEAGAAYGFHGSHVLIKASSEQTRGQLAVMECSYPAGLSVRCRAPYREVPRRRPRTRPR